MVCSSTRRRRVVAGRRLNVLWPVHLLEKDVSSREDASTSWPSSSGLRGRRRTCLTILESADHALSKIVRYVLLSYETEARWPRRGGVFPRRHVFVSYLTILELADHALFKMARYVLLRPLRRPELDGQDVEASSREDTSSLSR
jgi:hypothetical protein